MRYTGESILWYDPSYGIGPYANLSVYEDAAFDGYARACGGVLKFKKNEPNIQELVTVP